LGSRNASFHEGVWTGALLAPLKLAFVWGLGLAGFLVMAWMVDWLFVFQVWPEGIGRLKHLLAEDLLRTTELAAGQGWAPDAVTGLANLLYGLVFRVTGIHEMGMRFADPASLSIPDTIVRDAYIAHHEAIAMAMIGTQLLGVRLATLVLMLPLLALIYLVAAADGLTQRAIRRACGGRESASLYHRAKYLQVVLVAMSGAVTLIVPWSVDPRWVWGAATLAVGILARVQWVCYKKHL
jgi:integrating conjugative element membrane protein (TIGR03747 family)